MKTGAENAKGRILTAALLCGVILLGLGVRVYRLDEQSICFDDYNGMENIAQKDFHTYLERTLGPDSANFEHVPLYFVVEYFWAAVLGRDHVTLRLFSVLMGLLTIPLVYGIGRAIYGKQAGMFAALCVALSPFHIFHDQSIRPYALAILCGTLSIYAFVKALDSKNRFWWALNVIANLLLVWTHVLGVCLIVAEGIFLLLEGRQKPKRLVYWGCVHAVILIPIVLRGVAILHAPVGTPDAYVWFQAPGLRRLLFSLVAYDIVNNGEVTSNGVTWPFLPIRIAIPFIAGKGIANTLLVIALAAALVFQAGVVLRALTRKAARRDTAESAPVANTTLLLLIAVVPLIFLGLVSHVWRPMFFQRYAACSSLALYVLLAGTVVRIRFPWARHAAMGAVLILFAYQLSFMLPAATRTDWFGAAAHIEKNASPCDMILVGETEGFGISYQILRLHLPSSKIPVIPAYTAQCVCAKTTAFFATQRHDIECNTRDASVWVVLRCLLDYTDVLPKLETCLTARGMQFTKQMFWPPDPLVLYRITPGPHAMLDPTQDLPVVDTGVDYRKTVEELQLDFPTQEAKEDAIAFMRNLVDLECRPPRTPQAYEMLSRMAFTNGADELASAAATKALTLDENSVEANVILGSIHLLHGECEKALPYFDKARQTLPQITTLDPLITALCEKKDLPLARTLTATLESELSLFAIPFQAKLGALGDIHPCWAPYAR